MAYTRVQGTAKVSASGTTTTLPAFGTLPTVGNGLIVCCSLYYNSPPSSIQDTRGNPYTLAKFQGASSGSVAIYYCAKILVSAAPFTITLTHPSNQYFVASAIEIGGVGDGLILDKAVSATGTSAAPSSGTTAALTAAEVFLVAALQLSTSQSFITVQALVPAWTQEYEELAPTNTVGEADSRLLTGALGSTVSATWALSGSGNWTAALAAFKGSGGGGGGGGAEHAHTFVGGPV